MPPEGVPSGAGRVRTDDPRVANAMLSQLSYGPRVGKLELQKSGGSGFPSGRTKIRTWDLVVISDAL